MDDAQNREPAKLLKDAAAKPMLPEGYIGMPLPLLDDIIRILRELPARQVYEILKRIEGPEVVVATEKGGA